MSVDYSRPGFTPPTRAELEADEHGPDLYAGMLPCPHGCGSRFHGESAAYVAHVNARIDNGRCVDPWTGAPIGGAS